MYSEREYGWEKCKDDISVIKISEGIASIANSAFAGIDIFNIEFPQTITSIGDGAFKDCKYLWSIIFNGSSEDWAKVVIGDNNEPLIENSVLCYKESVMVYPILVISGNADKPRAAYGDMVAITAKVGKSR